MLTESVLFRGWMSMLAVQNHYNDTRCASSYYI